MADCATRRFDSAAIRAHAETFGKDRFQRQFHQLVDDVCRARGEHAP
jgi:hypothetical protein